MKNKYNFEALLVLYKSWWIAWNREFEKAESEENFDYVEKLKKLALTVSIANFDPDERMKPISEQVKEMEED